MKIKKTIAAIAAAAMVFSSLPMTVLADDVIDINDVVGGDYGVALMNAGVETEQTPVVQAAVTNVTVSGLQNGSGSGTMGQANGKTYVSVQLSADAVGSTEPSAEGGNSNVEGRLVYCVQIPVDGLTTDWSFGADSHYAPDAGDKANNIKNGELLLWLPTRDVTHTINLTDGTTTKTIYITTEVGATAPTEASVSGITGGTGTATVDGINVNVQLTPAEGGTIAGQPEGGVSSARENYYVVIPVAGIDSSWTFDEGSQYGYDKTSHFEWNISKGALKLWLPITDGGECTVKLRKGSETKTIVVKTKNGVPAPVHTTHTYGEWTSNEDGHFKTCTGCEVTIAELHSYVYFADGYEHWVECDVCGYIAGAAAAHVDSDKNGECDVCGSTDMRNLTETVTPAPSTGSSSSSSSAPVATVTTTTITSTTVSTPAQVRTSSKSNITINAADTKVTPAIVNAFTKNKKAKTLTVSYGTKMKIAIKKSDVKGVSATLDFSVSGKNFLSSKIKNSAALAKAKKIVQIDFVKEGKLDGVDKVTVQSRVGAKYVGQKATVYEYVNGKLIKRANGVVGGSGLVSFNIDHYGQYVVVVN